MTLVLKRTMSALLAVLLVCILEARLASAMEEPDLPVGLGKVESSGKPQLPEGLGSSDDPDLPSGLIVDMPKSTENNFQAEADKATENSTLDISGFVEARTGMRLQNDPTEKKSSVGEARLQLDLEYASDLMALKVVTDLLYDPVYSDHSVDIQDGTGLVDSREFNAVFRPSGFMDVKIGRQILTWGTGDLLFINDLFPKDWNAFLIGRDVEYLKAPSDAIKFAFFTDSMNLDLIYMPRFDPDRYIDGARVSFFNPVLGRIVGRDAVVKPLTPADTFADDELALRLYRPIGSFELAVYGYKGFWKSPVGFDPLIGKLFFPRLEVVGASARGPLGSGIGSVELGYYDSKDDSSGTNPFIPNEEFRFILGYEWELANQLTAGIQYYLEHMLDHTAYKDSLAVGIRAKDQDRHVITIRLSKLAMNQNLIISAFNFWSFSGRDGYLRFNANYKMSDSLKLETGINLFYGDRQDTFFSQFKDNTNMYVAVRKSF